MCCHIFAPMPKVFTKEDLQEESFCFKIVGKVMLSIGKPKRGA